MVHNHFLEGTNDIIVFTKDMVSMYLPKSNQILEIGKTYLKHIPHITLSYASDKQVAIPAVLLNQRLTLLEWHIILGHAS
jgi:hypothetical protein